MSSPTHEVKYFSYDSDINEIKRVLVREMNKLGAVRLRATYSGGHDDGGADDMTLYNKAGEEMVVTDHAAVYNGQLMAAVNGLLATKFYTWALGYSVYGHIYVDLNEKRAWTEGEMETITYENDGDPLELTW